MNKINTTAIILVLLFTPVYANAGLIKLIIDGISELFSSGRSVRHFSPDEDIVTGITPKPVKQLTKLDDEYFSSIEYELYNIELKEKRLLSKQYTHKRKKVIEYYWENLDESSMHSKYKNTSNIPKHVHIACQKIGARESLKEGIVNNVQSLEKINGDDKSELVKAILDSVAESSFSKLQGGFPVKIFINPRREIITITVDTPCMYSLSFEGKIVLN